MARAGGNPLFVEEIVRSLVGKGALVREAERWTVSASVETVSLPPTLHGLLLSRVDTLPADNRRVLQAAAVLGVSFDETLLQAVAGDVRTALERLVEADLVRDAGQGPGPLKRMAGIIASRTRCCTKRSTRTCCCRAAASCTNAPAGRLKRRSARRRRG